MKPTAILFIVTLLASAHAQQEPIVPAQPLPARQPLPPGAPKAPKELEKLGKQIEKTVEETLGPALELGAQATVNNLRVAQRALAAQNAELQDLHNSYTIYSGSSSSSRGNRSLVITTSEPDPAANANAELDLAIMSRILRKAVGSSEEERRVAMNIEVFGSASGARNMYLDGYGALFLLTVRYPLVAPADKPDEQKAKGTTSDEWNEERENELEETRGRSGYGTGTETIIRWTGSNRPTEEFDAEKVERLKTSLLESLKNATHVRALKPNDFVTVVVQGAEAIRIVESVKRKSTTTTNALGKPAPADSDKAPGASPKVSSKTSRSRTSLGETVMTIRVKKSDADAFAQGKLDLEAFRKKASIQAYFRKPTDPTSASVFLPAAR